MLKILFVNETEFRLKLFVGISCFYWWFLRTKMDAKKWPEDLEKLMNVAEELMGIKEESEVRESARLFFSQHA